MAFLGDLATSHQMTVCTTFKLCGDWCHLTSLKLTLNRVSTSQKSIHYKLELPSPESLMLNIYQHTTDTISLSLWVSCMGGQAVFRRLHHMCGLGPWTLDLWCDSHVWCYPPKSASWSFSETVVFLPAGQMRGYSDMNSIFPGPCLDLASDCDFPVLITQTDPPCILTVFFSS